MTITLGENGSANQLRADLASTASAALGDALIGVKQPFTDAAARTQHLKNAEWVSVTDFVGCDPTGATDSTAAFESAQNASKFVRIPSGSYLLGGFRPKNGLHLIGEGQENTNIIQKSAGVPAINCLSDVTVGQLAGLEISGFRVTGATSATVAAVLVAAYGAYAIWRSRFEFFAKNTFRALEVQGADSSNVFQCEFRVVSEGTTGSSVKINGGVYNIYDFFLSQCAGLAAEGGGANDLYTRMVTEGPISFTGQTCTIMGLSVENLPDLVGTVTYVVSDGGFATTYINPTITLNHAPSIAKVTGGMFSPFAQTVYINPQILCSSATLNPFNTSREKFTIIGPGRSNLTQKIDGIWTQTDDTNNLRNVSLVGDCSAFTTYSNPTHAGKTIQLNSPYTGGSITISPNTDCLILRPSGTIATLTVNVPTYLVNGQTLTVSTTNTVTALTVAAGGSGSDVSLLPATLSAGTAFTAIYDVYTNKWYKV